MRKHGAEYDAQNSLPHQDFWLVRTKVFAAFDFLFSKENVFLPSEAGKDFSLFVLLITDGLVRLLFWWPTKLCATRRAELICFSFAVFR
jgi:hypothetical protein